MCLLYHPSSIQRCRYSNNNSNNTNCNNIHHSIWLMSILLVWRIISIIILSSIIINMMLLLFHPCTFLMQAEANVVHHLLASESPTLVIHWKSPIYRVDVPHTTIESSLATKASSSSSSLRRGLWRLWDMMVCFGMQQSILDSYYSLIDLTILMIPV
jgi:hypothetical protein